MNGLCSCAGKRVSDQCEKHGRGTKPFADELVEAFIAGKLTTIIRDADAEFERGEALDSLTDLRGFIPKTENSGE